MACPPTSGLSRRPGTPVAGLPERHEMGRESAEPPSGGLGLSPGMSDLPYVEREEIYERSASQPGAPERAICGIPRMCLNTGSAGLFGR